MSCFAEKVADEKITKITLILNEIFKKILRRKVIMIEFDKKEDSKLKFNKSNMDIVDFQEF